MANASDAGRAWPPFSHRLCTQSAVTTATASANASWPLGKHGRQHSAGESGKLCGCVAEKMPARAKPATKKPSALREEGEAVRR